MRWGRVHRLYWGVWVMECKYVGKYVECKYVV